MIARVFIGLEFMIAALLLAHIFLKSFTYPATITLLVLLTLYLVVQIAQHGNTGNCGCFGEELEMTPLNAIWKNLAMIAATIALIYIYPVKPYRNQEWIGAIIGMAAIVTPFVLDPININTTPTVINKPINLDPLYEKAPMPHIDLRQGKHIVAFMSLSCPHCKKAARKFAVLRDRDPSLPVYMVLAGNEKNKKAFFDESKSQAVPHLLFHNKEAFLQMAGDAVPAIFYMHNGVAEREANYFQLDPQYIKDWLKHGH